MEHSGIGSGLFKFDVGVRPVGNVDFGVSVVRSGETYAGCRNSACVIYRGGRVLDEFSGGGIEARDGVVGGRCWAYHVSGTASASGCGNGSLPGCVVVSNGNVRSGDYLGSDSVLYGLSEVGNVRNSPSLRVNVVLVGDLRSGVVKGVAVLSFDGVSGERGSSRLDSPRGVSD